MDFEKKYPITQQPGEFILARWERGYKYVELYHRDRLIGSVTGAGKLRKGVTLKDDFFHTIRLKLSEQPIVLDLVIDGFHSPVNQEHPAKEMKRIATLLWMLSALSLIAGLVDVGRLSDMGGLQGFFTVVNMLIVGTYVTAAVLAGKGKGWPFFMAFGLFCVVFLFHLFLLSIGDSGILVYIFNVIRVGGVVFLAINLKTAIAAQRHARYGMHVNPDLLDN